MQTNRSFLGLRKLPASAASWILPLLLSLAMTCIVSLVSTLVNVGLVPQTLRLWLSAWAFSWVIAFPSLLVMLPVVRRLTLRIVGAP